MYLTVSSLNCSMQDLLWSGDSPVVRWRLSMQCSGLFASQHVGSQFLNQGLNPRPLHCTVDF